MRKAARHLLFALVACTMLASFQNCSGSGSNLPSASEMASSSGIGGGAAGGGGSGQWTCTAQGSSVHVSSGNREPNPISISAVGNDYEATGRQALNDCNFIMQNQIANPDGNEYEDNPCEVTALLGS